MRKLYVQPPAAAPTPPSRRMRRNRILTVCHYLPAGRGFPASAHDNANLDDTHNRTYSRPPLSRGGVNTVKRSPYIVALAVLSFLLIGPIPKSLAGPPAPRPKAAADTPIKALASGTDAAAYATGTIVHADALRSGKNALVDVDVAFSGSAFSTAPVEGVTNEVH